MIIDKRENMN